MSTKDYSIKDISHMSGVSIATLSRYFNGQSIRKSNEEKIKAVLAETGYKPNIAARFMKGQQTGIIGLILPEVTHYFFADIAEGVMEEARKNDMAVLCGSSEGSKEIERQIIDHFSRSILDGLIYIPVAQAEDIPSIESFRDLPLVVTARKNLFPGVPHVYHNGRKGGYLATKYLLSMGRKRILFAASFWNAPCSSSKELIEFLKDPHSGSFSSCDRLQGYIDALAEEGIPLDPELILLSGYSYDEGQRIGTEILSSFLDCSGIVLMDQVIAAGCRNMLTNQGIRIPNDISMMVFDAAGRNSAYDFSTVELRLKEMGRESVRQLRHLINGESATDICIDVTLKPNQTTSFLRS